GGRDLYELFRAQVAKAATPEQRDQLVRALAAFRDPALARATADYTMTEAVRPQDFWKPWVVLLRNSAVNKDAWAYLKANWAAIRAKAGPRAAAVIIEGLGGVHDLAIRAEAEAFFSDPANMEPTARRALAQSLEFMAMGANFEARERSAFSAWLKTRYPASRSRRGRVRDATVGRPVRHPRRARSGSGRGGPARGRRRRRR
ncbi:MAG: puromycin-sensitive aminopeptidase, partial [Elusimicrobia bacterium]